MLTGTHFGGVVAVKRRLADESGVVVPIALGILMLTLLVSAVAFQQAATATSSTNRDRAVKQAIAAADAGANLAAYRVKKLQPSASQCVAQAPGTGALSNVAGSGWCPALSAPVGGGQSFSYTMSPQVSGRRTIISTGFVKSPSGTTLSQRRVAVAVKSTASTSELFNGYGVSSYDGISMSGSTRISGNTQTNGSIDMSGSSQIVGDGTPGPGGRVTNSASSSVSGSTTPAANPFALDPVAIPAGANAGNAQICGSDPCTGSVSWNAGTRKLSLSGVDTLTLNGGTYVFCSISFSGSSKLKIPVRNPVTPTKIYIDSPANCGAGGGISGSASSGFQNANTDPTTLQIYAVGNTSIDLSGSSTISAAVYAPNAQVTLSGSTKIVGALAAKSFSFSGTSGVTYSDLVASIPGSGGGPAVYDLEAGSYRECSSVSSTGSPDGNC